VLAVNLWPEYNAGTLTPPVVVQHDTMPSGEHLIWVYTASGILGPYSRTTYDEATFTAEITEMLTAQEEADNADEVLA